MARIVFPRGFYVFGAVLCVAISGVLADDGPQRQSKKKDDKVKAAFASGEAKWSQIVAEINGEPITREELADELIEIHGAKQLEDLMNRKLVEQACRAQKVEVSRTEIESEIEDRVKRLNLTRKEFFDQVLAKVGKSHRQYVRDTVWPALALTKLVKGRVEITDADLREAFEAQFGDKVEVRMLVVRELNRAQELWQKANAEKDLKKRQDLFESYCKTYSIDTSTQPFAGAAVVHRHTSVPEIEKKAFALTEGELSQIIQVPQGNMMMLCVAKVPARQDVAMDTVADEKTKRTVHDVLYDDLYSSKTREEVAKFFQNLIKQAKVQNYLTGEFSIDSVQPTSSVHPNDPTGP